MLIKLAAALRNGVESATVLASLLILA